jgi:hypothetical protein
MVSVNSLLTCRPVVGEMVTELQYPVNDRKQDCAESGIDTATTARKPSSAVIRWMCRVMVVFLLQ